MSSSRFSLYWFSFFIVLLLFLLALGCQEQQPAFYKEADQKELVIKNKWLVNDANFDTETYKQNFDTYYNEGIKKQDYAQASDALLAVFQVMSSRGYYKDEYYYHILKEYVITYENEIKKDHLFSFYIYLGVVETFKGEFKKAIETLKNLERFEPYNFSTYSDLGYAYYYVSCNYFYLGDFIKSLEELKKASTYFDHTDNLQGKIRVESWRAHLHFNTKNLDDALTTVEKAIRLYDGIDDPTNQLSLMLSKHAYLTHSKSNLANNYLGTITDFVNKHTINDAGVLVRYNYIMVKKAIMEENITALDTLMPVFEAQVKAVNIEVFNNISAISKGKLQFLKTKKMKIGKN